MRQKDQIELNLGTGAKGEASKAAVQETEARAAKACLERPAVAGPSMEAVVERENLKKALAQVKRNKGAAGLDGMSVEDLPAYLKEHWPTIRAQLLEGTYKPCGGRKSTSRPGRVLSWTSTWRSSSTGSTMTS
jgi:RNA-directed DNA polymerase